MSRKYGTNGRDRDGEAALVWALMFLRYYVEIAVPTQAASSALCRLPQVLLEGMATEAMQRGQSLLAEVGFPVGLGRVGKWVEIQVGPPVETPSRTWLPLSWKATGADILFPTLEGELEAASLGKDCTQIGLSARYRPPFGVLGATMDRIFLHRVAEATISDFVGRVAKNLEAGWMLQSRTAAV
jgi:hypothetical protein